MQDQDAPSKSQRAQQFHAYFRAQSAAVTKQIEALSDVSTVAGEQADAIEHCLAGIARLSGEVKDATPYIPAYDQRNYSDAIKKLSDSLETTRSAVAPRPKFSFKTGRKNASAVSINDALQLDLASRNGLGLAGKFQPGQSSLNPSTTPSMAPTPSDSSEDVSSGLMMASRANRSSAALVVNGLSGESHVLQESFASSSTGPVAAVVSNSKRSLIDLRGQAPLAALTLRDISNCLIVSGRVDGPVHATGVSQSVLLLSCRQLRMHESHSVEVLLYCASRPIIEDCKSIVFAPLPAAAADPNARQENYRGGFTGEEHDYGPNKWDAVDDFKWLKAERSPNFALGDSDESAPGARPWQQLLRGGDSQDEVDELLKLAGVPIGTAPASH